MVYHKLQLDSERATGIFLRRGASQPSALSIFQVIPHQITSGQPVEWDAPVRLRHLLTGQYMALRPEHPNDSASIRAAAKLTQIRAAATGAAGSSNAPPASAPSSRPTTAGTEDSCSSSAPVAATDAEGGSNSSTSAPAPPVSPCPTATALEAMGSFSSSLDLSTGSDGNACPTPTTGESSTVVAGANGGPCASSSLLPHVRLVVATVSDPEDPATLFRFHAVRDADSSFVTSKSKCLLVHHETGAHLSLGHSLIAQHGKMSSGLLRGDRPGTGGGAGGGGGLSFASAAMAARAAAVFMKHDDANGREEGDAEEEARQAARYWEYENDSHVFASCEDNSVRLSVCECNQQTGSPSATIFVALLPTAIPHKQDAEVYRVYPVKPAATRNLFYALRFQSIIAEALEVVRGMRLDVLHPAAAAAAATAASPAAMGAQSAFFGTTTSAGVEAGEAAGGAGAAAAAASSSVRSRSTAGIKSGLLRSPTLLSHSNKQGSLRLTRSIGGGGIVRPEDLYAAACQHLLYALHELILWQSGEIDADGEIQRREGMPLVSLDGDDGSVRLYYGQEGKAGGGGANAFGSSSKKGAMFTASSAACGPTASSSSPAASRARGRSALMEKDEDSFDRDMTSRRRELLRNCHVVESLLVFISVAFQLYRGRTYARTRAELLAAAARGDAAAVAVMAAIDGSSGAGSDATAPDAHLLSPDAIPLIDACCRYAYKLLREMMTSSCALTVLYLSGVNSMVRLWIECRSLTSACRSLSPTLLSQSPQVRHISLGWDPPIEETLAAAIDQDTRGAAAAAKEASTSNSSTGDGPLGGAGPSDGVGGALVGTTGSGEWSRYRLSCSDLYQLVLELYASYMKKEITGTKILKLLANVRTTWSSVLSTLRYLCLDPLSLSHPSTPCLCLPHRCAPPATSSTPTCRPSSRGSSSTPSTRRAAAAVVASPTPTTPRPPPPSRSRSSRRCPR